MRIYEVDQNRSNNGCPLGGDRRSLGSAPAAIGTR